MSAFRSSSVVRVGFVLTERQVERERRGIAGGEGRRLDVFEDLAVADGDDADLEFVGFADFKVASGKSSQRARLLRAVAVDIDDGIFRNEHLDEAGADLVRRNAFRSGVKGRERGGALGIQRAFGIQLRRRGRRGGRDCRGVETRIDSATRKTGLRIQGVRLARGVAVAAAGTRRENGGLARIANRFAGERSARIASRFASERSARIAGERSAGRPIAAVAVADRPARIADVRGPTIVERAEEEVADAAKGRARNAKGRAGNAERRAGNAKRGADRRKRTIDGPAGIRIAVAVRDGIAVGNIFGVARELGALGVRAVERADFITSGVHVAEDERFPAKERIVGRGVSRAVRETGLKEPAKRKSVRCDRANRNGGNVTQRNVNVEFHGDTPHYARPTLEQTRTTNVILNRRAKRAPRAAWRRLLLLLRSRYAVCVKRERFLLASISKLVFCAMQIFKARLLFYIAHFAQIITSEKTFSKYFPTNFSLFEKFCLL